MGKKKFKKIRIIINNILDIIYPPCNKCLACDEDGFIGLCNICKNKINTLKYCNDINAYGIYGGVLKKLILSFKYEKNFTAGRVVSDLLIEFIKENNLEFDIICYVPMTKKSIKNRGFNQCKIIANSISDSLDIPISNCLIKVKDTKEQKFLSKEERQKNIINVFDIKNNFDIKNKTVLLIDDVFTTGATLLECRKILEKNDVNKTKILTIAKSNI